MNKYEIKKVVGQGSFGKAILCTRKADRKMCIIKQISIAKLSRKEAKATEQEATLLSKLTHPNIVTFWESFSSNGSLYIVMDFADGGDLGGYLKNQKTKLGGRVLPEKQVLTLFIQLALAIKHIHDRKILHRDLKADNVFLTSSGLLKLGDFGVSRVLRNTCELAATQIGTPYYMSPEIMSGQRYNSKTDIWSLGVMLYEMMTYKLPFGGNNMKQLIHNIVNGTPAWPSSASYSKEVRELVRDMLQKSSKVRPGINSILARPIIRGQISNFLNETKVHQEFSHTILHGADVLRSAVAAGKEQQQQQQVKANNPFGDILAKAAAKAPGLAPIAETRESSTSNSSKSNNSAPSSTPSSAAGTPSNPSSKPVQRATPSAPTPAAAVGPSSNKPYSLAGVAKPNNPPIQFAAKPSTPNAQIQQQQQQRAAAVAAAAGRPSAYKYTPSSNPASAAAAQNAARNRNPAVASVIAAFAPKNNPVSDKSPSPTPSQQQQGPGLPNPTSADYMAKLREEAVRKARQRYEQECKARDVMIEQEKERIRLKMKANADAKLAKEKAEAIQQMALQAQKDQAVAQARAKEKQAEAMREKILREMEAKKQRVKEMEIAAMARKKEEQEREVRRARELVKKKEQELAQNKQEAAAQAAIDRKEKAEAAARNKADIQQLFEQMKQGREEATRLSEQQAAGLRAAQRSPRDQQRAGAAALAAGRPTSGGKVRSSYSYSGAGAGAGAGAIPLNVEPKPYNKDRDSAAGGGVIYIPSSKPGSKPAVPTQSNRRLSEGGVVSSRINPPTRGKSSSPSPPNSARRESAPSAAQSVVRRAAPAPPPPQQSRVSRAHSPGSARDTPSPDHSVIDQQLADAEDEVAKAERMLREMKAEKLRLQQLKRKQQLENCIEVTNEVVRRHSSVEPVDDDASSLSSERSGSGAGGSRYHRSPVVAKPPAAVPGKQPAKPVARPQSLGGGGGLELDGVADIRSPPKEALQANANIAYNKNGINMKEAANTKWLNNLVSKMGDVKSQVEGIKYDRAAEPSGGAGPGAAPLSHRHEQLNSAVAASRAAPAVLSPLDAPNGRDRPSFAVAAQQAKRGEGFKAFLQGQKEAMQKNGSAVPPPIKMPVAVAKKAPKTGPKSLSPVPQHRLAKPVGGGVLVAAKSEDGKAAGFNVKEFRKQKDEERQQMRKLMMDKKNEMKKQKQQSNNDVAVPASRGGASPSPSAYSNDEDFADMDSGAGGDDSDYDDNSVQSGWNDNKDQPTEDEDEEDDILKLSITGSLKAWPDKNEFAALKEEGAKKQKGNNFVGQAVASVAAASSSSSSSEPASTGVFQGLQDDSDAEDEAVKRAKKAAMDAVTDEELLEALGEEEVLKAIDAEDASAMEYTMLMAQMQAVLVTGADAPKKNKPERVVTGDAPTAPSGGGDDDDLSDAPIEEDDDEFEEEDEILALSGIEEDDENDGTAEEGAEYGADMDGSDEEEEEIDVLEQRAGPGANNVNYMSDDSGWKSEGADGWGSQDDEGFAPREKEKTKAAASTTTPPPPVTSEEDAETQQKIAELEDGLMDRLGKRKLSKAVELLSDIGREEGDVLQKIEDILGEESLDCLDDLFELVTITSNA